MTSTLLVFLGAGIGGALRHGTNVAAARLLGTGFPWGIFAVYVAGSLAMGLLAGWLAFRAGPGWTQHTRLFLAKGCSAATPPSWPFRLMRCSCGSAGRRGSRSLM